MANRRKLTPLARLQVLGAALTLAFAFALTLTLALGAAPAGAVVIPGSNGESLGVMPRMANTDVSATTKVQPPVSAQGGPVMHSSAVYAIYWDSHTPATLWPLSYPQASKLTIDQFLADESFGSGTLGDVFSVNQQYIDSTGRAAYDSDYMGAYTDQVTAYPANACTDPNAAHDGGADVCLTDANIQAELQQVITAQGLPTGLSTAYVLLTPPNVVICTNAGSSNCSDTPSGGFCAYHSFYSTVANPVLYAALPWQPDNLLDAKACQPDATTPMQLPNWNVQTEPNGNEGASVPDAGDIEVNVLSHELNAMVTDPELNGWQDISSPSSPLELPDKCEGVGAGIGQDPWAFQPFLGSEQISQNPDFGTLYNQTIDGDNYYLQAEFNSAQLNCVQLVTLAPRWIGPSTAAVGARIGFDPSSTLATLGAASYTWSFGDGSADYTEPPGPDPSIYHSYATAGDYNITLTVTDGGGNTATLTRAIVVGHPAAATPPPDNSSPAPNNQPTSNDAPVVTTTTTTTSATTSSAATPASSAATTTKTTTTSSTSKSAGAGAHSAPSKGHGSAPKLTDTIAATTLSHALSKGLSVRYSVSEEVAGHFSVSIDRATARRLGLLGAASSSSTTSVVIGRAILEATKAGKASLAIKFAATATPHLRHATSLTVTVALTAVDAAGHSATVKSSAVLHG